MNHVSRYPQDIDYLKRPRYISSLLVRLNKMHDPTWELWLLPVDFVSTWTLVRNYFLFFNFSDRWLLE